ncbi:BlaI/MecI/CopY family transcriptional regulator [Sporosarcina saromensis]|uniref:BlaI/MecI/CopY family transcriptional regulator n=1 Tax=Sporosarcina saromensis TaxID=359365 RepID=A0ABU4G8J9_9BACL|nr:BlaI/MecI/CopY family transcriptional regulator [Sporosarcina saromensis]MDW0113301.1 BlaI/MecI/CopY family transcriptional regulator [Sporosarcina saromensis]
MKRLPDAELEIMLIIWNANEAVTRSWIQEQLEETKTLAPTTILSFLSRLTTKGFLKIVKEGKTNYYTPLISQEDYAHRESKTMLEKFFGNSVRNFVAQLNDSKAVDETEIQELRDFLDSLSSEEKK